MFRRLISIPLITAILAACTPQTTYTAPQVSGLKPLGAYPTAHDVCQRLATNEKTADYVEEGSFLIGCPSHETGAIWDRKREGAQTVGQVGAWMVLQLAGQPTKRTPIGSLTTSITRAPYAGNTLIYGGSAHGTQVEYFAPSGKVMLWYPTNGSALPGEVKFVNHKGADQICFRYNSSGKNPETGVVGYAWECNAVRSNLSGVQHVLAGDPFDLQSGGIPYVLERGKTVSLQTLLKRSGLSAGDVRRIGL